MSRSRIHLAQAPTQLAVDDESYPASLRLLAPMRPIRVAGTLPPLERAVAIVGTRTPDPEAAELARDLAYELGQAGCVVLSGGARGIDAAAHEGALDAGSPTVAVLATGLASAYPPTHGALFGRIANRGALLTESDD